MKLFISLLLLPALAGTGWSAMFQKTKRAPQPTALDRYVSEAAGRPAVEGTGSSAGSTWTAVSPLYDLARDLRAAQVDDLVTIIVAERASAVTTGTTTTSRKSSATNSIVALAGQMTPAGPLANLANLSGATALDGSGSTSRSTVLTTNLTARVTQVLPNGFLVVEGTKNVQVNSEWQTVTVRGVVRPADLAFDNSVFSERIAQLEVKLDGKGVVGDAIRRPNILYRILLGLLPF